MAVPNVFASDLFSEISLTETIMTTPLAPTGLSQYFDVKNSNTKFVWADRKQNKSILFNSYPRGGTEGNHMPSPTRDAIILPIPHFPVYDEILADSVQGVRKYGSENEMEGVQDKVSEKTQDMAEAIELNLESMRLGAIQGLVKNGDGTTLLDMFSSDTFNVTRTTFNIDLNGPATLKSQFMNLRRALQKKLGNGWPVTDIVLMIGFDAFSYIVQMDEVEDAYNDFQNRQMLRENQAISGVFTYAGVTLKLYDWDTEAGFPSAIDDSGNTASDMEGHAFPVVGGRKLFKEVYGPGDTNETVNVMGQKYFVTRKILDHNLGIQLRAQTNPLVYCTRPEVLFKVDFVAGSTTNAALI